MPGVGIAQRERGRGDREDGSEKKRKGHFLCAGTCVGEIIDIDI